MHLYLKQILYSCKLFVTTEAPLETDAISDCSADDEAQQAPVTVMHAMMMGIFASQQQQQQQQYSSDYCALRYRNAIRRQQHGVLSLRYRTSTVLTRQLFKSSEAHATNRSEVGHTSHASQVIKCKRMGHVFRSGT